MNRNVSTICDRTLAVARSQSSPPPGRLSMLKIVTLSVCEVP